MAVAINEYNPPYDMKYADGYDMPELTLKNKEQVVILSKKELEIALQRITTVMINNDNLFIENEEDDIDSDDESIDLNEDDTNNDNDSNINFEAIFDEELEESD
ncbi:hypothetical protein C1645_825667 [Glomus cerebriforme]|uniref:Uncharacterized protein n=1 Tax=Glomus cerebriforme TaxID=658196 RepID=A0A397SSA8_9GLOM|nr:hypothetical protein C1645_825667 [Glomus cerebriforme]